MQCVVERLPTLEKIGIEGLEEISDDVFARCGTRVLICWT